MKISKKLLGYFLATAGLCGLGLAPAKATLDFTLGHEFSGGATPSGPVKVSFETVGAGQVQLTISLAALTGPSEFVGEVYLNFAGTEAALSALSFGSITGPAAGSISTGLNAFKADGDGFFDILVDFNQDGDGRLSHGESVTILITGTGITENSFNSLSSGGGDPTKTGFPAAAHVQGITGQDQTSGFVSVPEPSTYVAAALLLIPLLVQFRRWKRAA